MKINLYFRSIQMGRGFLNKSRQMFWQLNKASLILGMEENLYIYVKACTHQDLSQQTLSKSNPPFLLYEISNQAYSSALYTYGYTDTRLVRRRLVDPLSPCKQA